MTGWFCYGLHGWAGLRRGAFGDSCKSKSAAQVCYACTDFRDEWVSVLHEFVLTVTGLGVRFVVVNSRFFADRYSGVCGRSFIHLRISSDRCDFAFECFPSPPL